MHGGEALGRCEGQVVFVAHGAPGDEVRVRVTDQRRSFCRAEIEEILEPGPGRRPPPCPLVGRCGGCSWQHLDYATQTRHKQALAARLLERLPVELVGYFPSETEFGYRRRVRLQVDSDGQGLRMGFFERRSRAPCPVETCPLLVPALDEALTACRSFAPVLGPGSGTLSLLAGADGDVVFSLRWQGRDGRPIEARDLPLRAPLRGGLTLQGQHRQSVGTPALLLHGSREQPPAYPSLWASASAFAQAHAGQERRLLDLVLALVPTGTRHLLELHAGIGTFTLPLAARVPEVTAVEVSAEAMALLRRNITLQGRSVTLVEQPAEVALAHPQGPVDLLLLDPPREGLPSLARLLGPVEPPRVIYVSCDPMTLLRDARALSDLGYRPRSAYALDMMPQTHHLEIVLLLEKT